MYYTLENPFDVKLDIDVKQLVETLDKKFKNKEEIKKIIRDESSFKLLLEELHLDMEDFFKLLALGKPEVYTGQLITFIRDRYLFKQEDSEFVRL